METIRQFGGSLLLAVVSIVLVVGGISLALAESYVPEIPTPTGTHAPTSLSNASVTGTGTSTQATITLAAVMSSPSATILPPTSCPPPSGWIAVTVQPGDTLMALASRYSSTPENLTAANCLFSSDLPTGSIVYVPPFPTQTTIPCGPPPSWIRYTVRPGNTLTSLSVAFGVSVSQLQFANCMASNQYYLSYGQVIMVPNVPTRTPRATGTATLTPVSMIFPTLTWTPSATPTETNTPIPTATPTSSPVPSPTATVPLPTTPPIATATITAFPSSTSTVVP